MEQRQFGQLESQVSVLGMGGLVVSERRQTDVNRTVEDAFNHGITYFDCGPVYGNCEELLGPAIEPYRSDIFLACKTHKRTADQASQELERSLVRLKTDHLDLYQMHALGSIEELETALGDGGVIEAMLAARDEGKTRYLGFSTHSNEVALKAIDSGHFDAILFPINFNAYENTDLGRPVLEAAAKLGMGIMAIKAMARTEVAKGKQRPYPKCWYEPEDSPDLARLQLRYTLSLPGVCGAIPPGNPALFDMAMHSSHLTKPLNEEEKAILVDATKGIQPVFGG